MLALLDEEVSQIEGQEQNLKMHQVSDTSHPFFARNCAELVPLLLPPIYRAVQLLNKL